MSVERPTTPPENPQAPPSKHSRAPSSTVTSPLPKRTKPDHLMENLGTSANMSQPIISQEDGFSATSGTIPLQVKLLHSNAKAPARGSKHSAGYDLYVSESGVIPARGKAMLSTGCAIAIPPGTYARVAPRSGLAAKHGLATGAGVIDFDYRGEVKLVMFNHSDVDFKVEAGDRMAQLVLERIVNPEVQIVEELEGTERGAGGFGSTGGFGGPVKDEVEKIVKQGLT